MKHLRFILIGAFVLAFTAPQVADAKIGGLRAGWQYSGIYDNGTMVNDALNTFYVGFTKDNKIVPLLHFTSGLEYFQTGYDNPEFRMHTISAPMSLKLKVGPVFALAGIAANFKVSESGGASLLRKANWFDYPLHAGVGVQILMFGIEARYHWGMNEVWDNGQKNRYLQIGAFVYF